MTLLIIGLICMMVVLEIGCIITGSPILGGLVWAVFVGTFLTAGLAFFAGFILAGIFSGPGASVDSLWGTYFKWSLIPFGIFMYPLTFLCGVCRTG